MTIQVKLKSANCGLFLWRQNNAKKAFNQWFFLNVDWEPIKHIKYPGGERVGRTNDGSPAC